MNLNLAESSTYRRDVDGLRAIAVLAVIFFHFGLLPNGFLGVDIFFVISGYLITGIIYRELQEDRFSITHFYLRRIRRILPLTLVVVTTALLVGIFVMLPDDLENLAQSVVATNLISNNILQAITTKNYWDVVNEFKPLMHTWSLGIEEQYYMFFPLLILVIGRKYHKVLLPALCIIGAISLVLFFLPFKEYQKFYYLPFRFFELAIGGIAALVFKNKVLDHKFSIILILALLSFLFINFSFLSSELALLLTVILTAGVLVSNNGNSQITTLLLENKLFVGIGLISFSLYMWHQVLMAYSRYFLFQHPQTHHIVSIFIAITLLSLLSYYFVEKPFRNKKSISTPFVLAFVAILSISTTAISLYIYYKGGVIRDVPELGISKSEAGRNIHSKYNSRVHNYNKNFNEHPGKLNILVIGNSFARDWANVLLESNYRDRLNLSYTPETQKTTELTARAEKADLIFYSTATKEDVEQAGLDQEKLYVIGTKNFGINSGYFYNYSGPNYFDQRTHLEKGHLEFNKTLSQTWQDRFIDLIQKVIDKNQTVPVFTDQNMFISQDCRHFTEAGAIYFASLFDEELSKILSQPSLTP